MNGTDQLIAEALREIADQAATPPRMAGAAWQAGRRRRLNVVATSAAAVAGATAIAVMFPLALTGSPRAGGPGHGSGQGPATATAPVRLRAPILFEQVASISHAHCAAGTDQVPGNPPAGCVHLTGTGMTVTGINSARVQRVKQHQYVVDLTLTRADSRLFAALSRNLAGQPRPHDEFAVISGGRALDLPQVEAPMTGSHLQIFGFTSRAQAEKLLRTVPR